MCGSREVIMIRSTAVGRDTESFIFNDESNVLLSL